MMASQHTLHCRNLSAHDGDGGPEAEEFADEGNGRGELQVRGRRRIRAVVNG